MKTILLAAPNSYVIRNWIAGELADQCLGRLEASPVVLSPFREAAFTTPGGAQITNHCVITGLPGLFQRLLVLRSHVYAREVPFASSQMTRISGLRNHYHYAARAIGPAVPRPSRRRRWARRLFEAGIPSFPEVGRLLAESRAALVVTGTPGFYPLDLAVLSEARRRGIPRLCVINSWDNMTTRGSMICRPERLAVWNREMQRKALEIHQFPLERTALVGALQFVPYATRPSPAEMKGLYRRLELPEGQPYFLYVSSQLFQSYEAEETQLLAEGLAQTSFSRIPLVVRLHPQAERRAFEQRGPRVVLDQAPAFSDQGTGGFSFGLEETRHLAALLSGAEAVFSTIATTAILEAVLWDRPAIQLHWTEIPRKSPAAQVRGVHWSRSYPHIRFFDETGCTLFSREPGDLEETMRRALESPSLRESRRRAIGSLVTPPLSAPPGRIVTLMKEMADVG